MNLLWAVVIVAALIILYMIYAAAIDGLDHVDEIGYWAGTDEFLNTAKLYSLDVDFSDSKLTMLITPMEGQVSLQTYKYKIKGNTITITAEVSDGEPILPDGDLTIEQKENELAVIDDATTYFVVTRT